MTCKDVIELVDAIAAGDLEPTAELRAHIWGELQAPNATRRAEVA